MYTAAPKTASTSARRNFLPFIQIPKNYDQNLFKKKIQSRIVAVWNIFLLKARHFRKNGERPISEVTDDGSSVGREAAAGHSAARTATNFMVR